MFCKKCGTKLDENSLFCNMCGTSVITLERPNQTNIFSVIGLVLSLISLFLNYWGTVSITAVILSTLGLVEVNKSREKGKGMAIAGLLIGMISIIVYAISLVTILEQF